MRQRRTSIVRLWSRRATVAGTSSFLALALVSGCSGGGDPSTSASATSTPSVTTSAPATASTTTATPTSSPSSTPTPTATRWPRALGEPQDGDAAWAVYLAVAHSSSDDALEAARSKAGDVGYGAVIGDLACDRGAMEALKLDVHDYWVGAVLYFANQKDADDFASSYVASGGTVVGVAKIGLGCLD